MTLREALDILELNPNSLDRQLLESTLRKNLESIELRNVMRLLEAYRKANAFINPTLATHGDVRVTMIDEPVPDGPPLNQRPAAKRLADESNQKLKRDFVPGATFDESILKAPRTSSPPTLSDASSFATQEIMPDELPALMVAAKTPKNNVLITPEDHVSQTKGVSFLWAGLTAAAGVALAVFVVIPVLSGFLPNNSGVQAAVKPANTTKPVISSSTTKPVISSSTTSNPTTQSAQAAQLEAQKVAAQKLEAQKLAAQKVAAQKLEAQKVAAQKLETQKLAAQKLAAQKVAVQKLEAQKLAAQKLEAQKLATQKLAVQKLEAQKLAAQKALANKPITSTFTPNNNAQLEAQAALRASQRRAAIRAEANRLAQQRAETQRLALRRSEQQAAARREAEQIARRAEQQAIAKRAEQQAIAKRAEQQAIAKRASVSVRSINQGSFNSWDRAGAVLRYSSWTAIPDSVRALPTTQFRAQVYVASSPANLPGLPR